MASYRKLKTGWKVTISTRDGEGKLHQISKQGFATKKDAQAYASRHEFVQSANGSVAFSQYYWNWVATYKEKKVRANSLALYEYAGKVLERYFGSKRLKDITRSDYQVFLNDLGNRFTKGTVSVYTSKYQACVQSAIADDLIQKDFTAGTEKTCQTSSVVEYLELDEIRRLIAYVEQKMQTKPDALSYYIIYTAIYTGMRIGEIIALDWTDIDWKNHAISVDKTYNTLMKTVGPPKTASSVRTIAVPEKLLTALNRLKKRNTKTPFSHAGRYLNPNSANRCLKSCLSSIGIDKNFHFHCLRHSHVALLLAADVDLYAISKRLGHKDTTITAKTYAYLLEDKRKHEDNKIINALNGI